MRANTSGPGSGLAQGAVTERIASQVLRRIERVANRSGQRSADVFDDWLDMVGSTLTNLPAMALAALAGDHFEESPTDRRSWSRWESRYSAADRLLLSECLGELICSVDDGYQDVLGCVYMRGGLGGGLGQFFTPMPVAAMMAAATFGDVCAMVWDRIAVAVRQSPLSAALLIAADGMGDDVAGLWFEERVLPLVAGQVEAVKVADPAVGSGVMLLAAASQVPRWMLDAGLVSFWGTDADATCVKMAQINMQLYGLNGYGAAMFSVTSE